LATTERLEIELEVEADGVKVGVGKATDSLNGLEKGVDKADARIKQLNKGFGEMQSLGNKMSMMVTAPLVALGTASVKSAMDFGVGMAQMSTQFGNVDVNSKNLEQTIKSMSKEFGIGAGVIQNGYYEALSSGIPVTEDMAVATAFVTNNAKLAKAGFTSLDTAVDATTSILNAYGLSADKVNSISNVLIKTQDYGKTTVDELGKTIAQVTPEASALGVNFEQVGAAISTMTAQGINTPETMTKLKRLFIELRDTTTGAGEAFNKISGQSFKDFIAGGGDVQTAMQMMSDYAVVNGLELGNMFSSAEAGSAALVLTSQNGAALFKESYLDMQSGVDTLSSSFDKMNNTDQANFQRTLEALKVAAIDLGISLMPVATQIIDDLGEMIERWNSLSPGVQEAVINFGLFAVAAGPIISTIGTIGGAVTTLSGLFGGAATATVAAGTAAGGTAVATAGLGSALGAATLAAAPFVLGAIAIGGAVWATNEAVQSTVPQVDYLADSVTNLDGVAKASFSNVGTNAENMNKTIRGTVDEATGGMYNLGLTATQISEEYGVAYNDMIKVTNEFDVEAQKSSSSIKVTISDTTKEAISSYMQMSDEVKSTYHSMWATQEKITAESSGNIAEIEMEMKNQILAGYDDKKNQILASTQELFLSTTTITKEEKDAILKTTEEKFEQEKQMAEDTFAEIAKIRETASNENRAITREEQQKIVELINEGNSQATSALSQNAVEREIILTNLKNSSVAVTEQMVADAVTKMNKQRDETVSIAEGEYSERLRAIISLRDESKTISSGQADALIADAQRQKDAVVKEAEKMRTEGLDMLKEEHGDLAGNIDADTGKIQEGWGRMFDKWKGWKPENKSMTVTTEHITKGNPSVSGAPVNEYQQTMGFATGTTYAPGGWAEINERGFEMVNLPTGSQVIPHDATKYLLDRQAKANVANNVTPEVIVNNNFEIAGNINGLVKIIRRELD